LRQHQVNNVAVKQHRDTADREGTDREQAVFF